MGSGGSKTDRNLQKLGCRYTDKKLKGNVIKNNEVLNQKYLEEQKIEYEKKYQKLEQDHNKLQADFLELKAKYDQDIMNAGDFASHANQVNRKLEEAFYELEAEVPGDSMLIGPSLNQTGSWENCVQENGDIARVCEDSNMKKITDLQRELDKLLTENANKEHEIEDLRNEMETTKLKAEEEKSMLKEEFTTKGLLLCERYEEEKKELNSIWEDKLTYPYREVINNCNQDISTFRAKLNREKSSLEKKLDFAMSELAALEKKYKLLNHLFEDIRSRYEARESKTEDLERIADLEGQLILQAEELEKQKDLLRNVKCGGSINSETISGCGRRSKKNAKKRKKQVQEVSE